MTNRRLDTYGLSQCKRGDTVMSNDIVYLLALLSRLARTTIHRAGPETTRSVVRCFPLLSKLRKSMQNWWSTFSSSPENARWRLILLISPINRVAIFKQCNDAAQAADMEWDTIETNGCYSAITEWLRSLLLRAILLLASLKYLETAQPMCSGSLRLYWGWCFRKFWKGYGSW